MPLTLTSVRATLAALAGAGLVLMSLMAVLLLQTTNAAYDVVQRAHQSHERMRAFARLQSAGDRLQTVSYDAVRAGQPKGAQALETARTQFKTDLARVEALPMTNDHERRVGAQVAAQGEVVLALFSAGSEIVRRVDARWRTSGSIAALRVELLGVDRHDRAVRHIVAPRDPRAGDHHLLHRGVGRLGGRVLGQRGVCAHAHEAGGQNEHAGGANGRPPQPSRASCFSLDRMHRVPLVGFLVWHQAVKPFDAAHAASSSGGSWMDSVDFAQTVASRRRSSVGTDARLSAHRQFSPMLSPSGRRLCGALRQAVECPTIRLRRVLAGGDDSPLSGG